ncbi:MAG: hypothetical protein IID44_15865 [Planctomycetes bacterium]|nr:hypothetical protein [Planctomycetota bacterium]
MTATATRIDSILSKLSGVRAAGDGKWSAQCPGHDDRTASLSVTEGTDGRVLVFCHAGCETPAVLSAIGLTVKDLFTDADYPQNGNGKPKIVKIYDYQDASGGLLFQAVRYEPKDFRQRQPKEGGGWTWNLRGVERVLYRLPDLLADDTALVTFVAAGEKDVDRLRSMGLPATCNPMGEGPGKWQSSYSDVLAGRKVAILVDNDDTGREHAARVAKSLAGKAASIKLIELPGLPEGGDVSDWLDAGGTADELLAIVEATDEAVSAIPDKKPTQQIGEDSAGERLANYENVETVDAKGKAKTTRVPVTMTKLLADLRASSADWPRRIGSALFVHDGLGISWLTNTAAMFGWAGSAIGKVDWAEGAGYVTKAELFAEVKRTATSYDAVEDLPRIPPLPRTYCTMATPAPGDGKMLEKLIDRFNPETPADRSLMLAAFVTPMWGGPPGGNPVFAITAKGGRGKGKTAFADAVARVYGGSIDLNPKEEIQKVKERLLSPDAATKRIIRLDNIKSPRFSSPAFEGLITSPVINGRKMYVGDASRPNSMTWLLTLNGPSMSTDMSQRCVVIALAAPKRSGSWQDETNELIDDNREALIADVVGFFERPQQHFGGFTRWATWERDILARVPGHVEAQAAIAVRQSETDAEGEEGDVVEDYFQGQLKRFGYDPDREEVFLPSAVTCDWYNRATNERRNSVALGRMIRQQIGEGQLTRLRVNDCRTWGRGFIWTPTTIEPGSIVRRDIKEAMASTLRMEGEQHVA